MKRTLIAALAIGLATFGIACDDDTTTATDAAAGHDGGGTGGSATAGADGSVSDSGGGTGGGGAAGSDAAASDAPASDAAAVDSSDDSGSSDASDSDASTDAVSAVADWSTCDSVNMTKPGVSAASMCAYYLTTCTFDSTGGTAGAERYTSLVDCVNKYNALSDAAKSCAAYHLCVAGSKPENKTPHCPHPPETPTTGPCAGK